MIDLSQVSYMDSSALGALVSGMTSLKKENGERRRLYKAFNWLFLIGSPMPAERSESRG